MDSVGTFCPEHLHSDFGDQARFDAHLVILNLSYSRLTPFCQGGN